MQKSIQERHPAALLLVPDTPLSTLDMSTKPLIAKGVNSSLVGSQSTFVFKRLRTHGVICSEQDSQVRIDLFRDMEFSIIRGPVAEGK